MIERIHVNERSSKIVKHSGVVYLTGQVAEGDTIQDQVRACLQKIEMLLEEARIVQRANVKSHNLAC